LEGQADLQMKTAGNGQRRYQKNDLVENSSGKICRI